MTNDQIQLVKNSWGQVTPIANEAGELFYKNLFEAAPEVRSLFKTDVKDQSKKLIAMLSTVVSKLDNLDAIIGEVKALAKRHNKYGTQPEHYAVVGQSLIKTLKTGLAGKWNQETEEAWLAAFTILSGAMIAAQAEA